MSMSRVHPNVMSNFGMKHSFHKIKLRGQFWLSYSISLFLLSWYNPASGILCTWQNIMCKSRILIWTYPVQTNKYSMIMSWKTSFFPFVLFLFPSLFVHHHYFSHTYTSGDFDAPLHSHMCILKSKCVLNYKYLIMAKPL